MNARHLSRLLLANLGPSAVVAVFMTGLVTGVGLRTLPFAALLLLLVWAASSLAALLWYRYRRAARWNYFEGLLWGLLVFLLSAVPFLWLYIRSSPNGGAGPYVQMSFLEWLYLSAVFSSPMLLLVAPFVPLLWRWAAEGPRGEA